MNMGPTLHTIMADRMIGEYMGLFPIGLEELFLSIREHGLIRRFTQPGMAMGYINQQMADSPG